MTISTPSAYSVVKLVTATQLSIKLSSSNYPTWYKKVTLLLTANNVLCYLKGTLDHAWSSPLSRHRSLSQDFLILIGLEILMITSLLLPILFICIMKNKEMNKDEQK